MSSLMGLRMNVLGKALAMAGTKRFSSTASNSYVKRLTFFKVAKEEDIDAVLKEYETLRRNAVRVSRPICCSICNSCCQ